ncbi:MAG: hypothetical protein LBK82_02365, partial [Planctomycetaceae bacterium]|nr:hypothetical protein [Planctomycetaceae bacterium]
MKLILYNTSNLRIILTTICSVILCVGIVAAEEISDFEKMLREALQNNRNNQSQKTDRNSDNVAPKPLSTASRNGLPLSTLDAKPKPKEPVPVKSVRPELIQPAPVKPAPLTQVPVEPVKSGVKTSPPEPINLNSLNNPNNLNNLNDGWVALKPNESAIPKANIGNGKSVLIAEATKSGAPTIDPNASVWDAVPETVSQPPKTQGFEKPESLPPQNTTPNSTKPTEITKPTANPVIIQPSPSPWDTVADKKNTESEPNAIDWSIVANGNEEEKKETETTEIKVPAIKLETPSEESVEKTPTLPSEKKSAQDSEVQESVVPNPETPSENNSPKHTSEQPELTVPKSKTPEIIGEKAEEAKKDLNNDMDSILNALAKESKEEREEKTKPETTNKNNKS